MSRCQTHREAASPRFMYLIKAMLSDFNLSRGLTAATACVFYFRQPLCWLQTAEMKSVLFFFLLLPFPWNEGRQIWWRTIGLDVEHDRWDCNSNWCWCSILLIKYTFLHPLHVIMSLFFPYLTTDISPTFDWIIKLMKQKYLNSYFKKPQQFIFFGVTAGSSFGLVPSKGPVKGKLSTLSCIHLQCSQSRVENRIRSAGDPSLGGSLVT